MKYHRYLHFALSALTVIILSACQPNTPGSQPAPSPLHLDPPTPAATHGMDLETIPQTSTTQNQSSPTTSLSTPTESIPTWPVRQPAGKFVFPGKQISALAIGETEIFWVTKDDPRIIFGSPLSSGASINPVEIAQSSFITGNLGSMPILVRGSWLLFLDQAFNAKNPLWKLRAVNLQTQKERLLDQAGGNLLARIYSFSTDGRTAAWIVQKHVGLAACQEASVILTADLASGKVNELIKSCPGSDRQWFSVQVSGSKVLASGNDVRSGNVNRMILFDLKDSSSHAISDPFPGDDPSFPALNTTSAAWQNGGDATRVVALSGGQTAEIKTLPDGSPAAAPTIDENWMAWLPNPDLYLYSLDTQQFLLAAAADKNEKIRLPTLNNGWAAWCRETADNSGRITTSQIEWFPLQP